MRHRRPAILILCAALLLGAWVDDASAHAGLSSSDPGAGATLGASPTAIRLTFSEQPAPSLSSIRVSGRGDVAQPASPAQLARDRLSLVVPVRQLGRGVYTVTWRVVSAVDGHASAGAYAFGVEVSPRGVAVVQPTVKASTSKLELLARWVLLVGLGVLLGATVAGVARFGGSGGTDLLLAGAGCMTSIVGLLLLAEAQRRTAHSSLADLLKTPVGEALVWRAVAIAAAGTALLVAARVPRRRRVALAAAAVCGAGAIVSHVAAGHAAAGTWPTELTVLAQVTHFAAAGIWFGGLLALLAGLRGAPPEARSAPVRRFSAVALGAVIVVAATGLVRAIDELSSFGELASSGYGRAVVAKVVLLALIVALAARNRRRGVPAVASDLRPLRRASRAELVLAVGALATAAVLGTLAPPVAGQPSVSRGLTASGSDAAKTVRVRLTAVSDEPGPNRFVARVDPAPAGHVLLRFTPLDDPGVRTTSLSLQRSANGSWSGSGANLRFDGRWLATVVVPRTAGPPVEVPLELDVRGPENPVSILRVPGQPPAYTMQLGGNSGYIRISPDPERAGPSTIAVYVLDPFESALPVRRLVLTTAAGAGPARQQPVLPLGRGRFAVPVVLQPGRFRIAVVARARIGLRLRAEFELDIPRG